MPHQRLAVKAIMAATLLALISAGCGGTAAPQTTATEEAGTPGAEATASSGEAVTLTMANALIDMPDQLIAWGAEVRRQTDDSITLDVKSSYGDTTAWDDKEQAVLAAIAAGDVDLAWVGARAIPAFAALHSPMLIDSHDLQAEIFAAGIPDRLLEDAGIDGVTGLGVLPGPHRRVLAVTREVRTPADFSGAVIMSEQNAVTLETLAALEGESVPGVEGAGLEGVDILLAQVGAVVGNNHQGQAQSFTTNLNLWPRPLVLLANTAVLEGLDEQQRRALLESATTTLQEQMEITRDQDRLSGDARAALCSSTLQFVELTQGELAEFRSAVDPVSDRLRQDPDAGDAVVEIERIKEGLGMAPDAFSCEAS
jgi:TRAP-type transport system periplasmic protein